MKQALFYAFVSLLILGNSLKTQSTLQNALVLRSEETTGYGHNIVIDPESVYGHRIQQVVDHSVGIDNHAKFFFGWYSLGPDVPLMYSVYQLNGRKQGVTHDDYKFIQQSPSKLEEVMKLSSAIVAVTQKDFSQITSIMFPPQDVVAEVASMVEKLHKRFDVIESQLEDIENSIASIAESLNGMQRGAAMKHLTLARVHLESFLLSDPPTYDHLLEGRDELVKGFAYLKELLKGAKCHVQSHEFSGALLSYEQTLIFNELLLGVIARLGQVEGFDPYTTNVEGLSIMTILKQMGEHIQEVIPYFRDTNGGEPIILTTMWNVHSRESFITCHGSTCNRGLVPRTEDFIMTLDYRIQYRLDCLGLFVNGEQVEDQKEHILRGKVERLLSSKYDQQIRTLGSNLYEVSKWMCHFLNACP